MATPDIGHQMTDQKLAALEQRIASIYRTAGKEMQDKINAYFESFAKRDAEMRERIGTMVNGKEWTMQDYRQWRLAQIGRGQRFQALRDALANRMTEANTVAMAYINDAMPGIYSLNRNYAAYTIEQVAGMVGFTLWDEQTVRRLLVEEPDLMPYYPPQKAVKRGIDLAWGKKQITTQITQAILQGEGLKKMADRLQKNIPAMNRNSAIRTARTAFTGAQNAGRMDSYAAAEKMGIKVRKQWMATLDSRTRHSHARLDGEVVAYDEKFSNGCRYPGDTQGKPAEVYNCRCTMIAKLDGGDTNNALRRNRDGLIPDMTYAQWEASKRGYSGKAVSKINDEPVKQWRRALQNKENIATLKAKIESGDISIKIRPSQQAKHMEGTPQFRQYQQSRISKGQTPQSILTISAQEAQTLVDKYAGTGIVQITKTGQTSVKVVEFCTADFTVGRYYVNNVYQDTKRFGIYYSKNGTHIVPVKENYND